MVLKTMEKSPAWSVKETEVDVAVCDHVSVTNGQQILTKCSLHTHVGWGRTFQICFKVPLWEPAYSERGLFDSKEIAFTPDRKH